MPIKLPLNEHREQVRPCLRARRVVGCTCRYRRSCERSAAPVRSALAGHRRLAADRGPDRLRSAQSLARLRACTSGSTGQSGALWRPCPAAAGRGSAAPPAANARDIRCRCRRQRSPRAFRIAFEDLLVGVQDAVFMSSSSARGAPAPRRQPSTNADQPPARRPDGVAHMLDPRRGGHGCHPQITTETLARTPSARALDYRPGSGRFCGAVSDTGIHTAARPPRQRWLHRPG